MKKTVILFLTGILLTGCSTGDAVSTTETTASASSADSANNAGAIQLETTTADMSAYVFLDDDDPAFVEVSSEESLRLFNEGGTGVIVYSYESCPWCNRILPVLNDAAKEYGITVFYCNIYSDEFMSLSNDEKSSIISDLYEVLDPILNHERNDETGEVEAEFQVPEVVAVKDGEIVSHHLGVVDGFELDTELLDEYQVTDDQVEELKEIYLEMFASIE